MAYITDTQFYISEYTPDNDVLVVTVNYTWQYSQGTPQPPGSTLTALGNYHECKISLDGDPFEASVIQQWAGDDTLVFTIGIRRAPVSDIWKVEILDLNTGNVIRSPDIYVPQYRTPFITGYAANKNLLVRFDGMSGLGKYASRDVITARAQKNGGGGIVFDSTSLVEHNTTAGILFYPQFLFSITDDYASWDFFLTNQTTNETVVYRNISAPCLTDLTIVSYNEGVNMRCSVLTRGLDTWQTGDDLRMIMNNGPDTIVAGRTNTYDVATRLTYDFDLTGVTTFEWDLFVINQSIAGPAHNNLIIFTLVDIRCFVEGTLIRTASGDVPVESLKVGDRVISVGTLKDRKNFEPYSSVESVEIKNMIEFEVPYETLNDKKRPVKIKAGALEANVPEQDLYVSPCHGMVVDGVLQNAGTLVNGDTIDYDRSVQSVKYYHIELEQHSVILANGAKAESYFDDSESREKPTPENGFRGLIGM
jgi:hypothetical protein